MLAPDCFMIDRRILLEAQSIIKMGQTVTLLSGFECTKEEHYSRNSMDIHRYVYDWDDYRLKSIRRFLPQNQQIQQIINRGFIIFANTFLTLSPFERFVYEKASRFDFDLIHCHDLPVLKPAVLLSAERDVPLIYDAHELYPSQKIHPLRLRMRNYINERMYIKYADYVITVNQFIAEIMKKRYGIRDIGVLMNCTEPPEYFSPDDYRGYLREKLNLSKDKKIVLFQGVISRERNIDSIVKAFKYLGDDIKLVFIGYGDYVERLKDLIKKERLKRRVFYLGQVPSDEILKYTAGADLGIIPYEPIDENHLYCSPNKFFEFIISGVPVMANRLPFFEMMNEKYGVVVFADMKRPLELAKRIKEILLNDEEIMRLRTNAISASEELNWRTEEKKLYDIYDTIFEYHRRKRGMKRRRFFYLPAIALLGTYIACKAGPEMQLTPEQNAYMVGQEIEIMIRYLPPDNPEVQFWVKRNPEDWVMVQNYSKNPVIKYKFNLPGDYAFEAHIKDPKSPQGFKALWKGMYTVFPEEGSKK